MARVQRPVRRAEFDYNELPFVLSSASTTPHPWVYTDEELDVVLAEHRTVMAKKRPLGFAPWPQED